MTDETAHANTASTATHIENSTDATRGEALALRAQKRKVELEAVLATLPAGESLARSDIELVLTSIDSLLTGDTQHLTETTASDLSRVLENSKHLAERAVQSTP